MLDSIEKLTNYNCKPKKYRHRVDDSWVFGHLLAFPGLGKKGEGFFCPIGAKFGASTVWVDVSELSDPNNIELYLYT
jgi:hypothetical protein